jgi:hypothetical protein
VRHCMGDRQKQGVWRTPTPQGTPLKSRRGRLTGRIDWPRHYRSIRIIAFEYPIQGLKFTERVGPQGISPVSENEGTKPFPKGARLRGNRVEFSR